VVHCEPGMQTHALRGLRLSACWVHGAAAAAAAARDEKRVYKARAAPAGPGAAALQRLWQPQCEDCHASRIWERAKEGRVQLCTSWQQADAGGLCHAMAPAAVKDPVGRQSAAK